MSDENRVLTLTNGRAPLNKKGDLVTQKQVEEFVETFANTILVPHIDGMIQHYMKQIPGLVATMLADALKANGMEMKGPQLDPGGSLPPKE